MRAALLNSTRIGFLPPAGDDPRDPAIDVTQTPVEGGVVVAGPPVRTNSFDILKAKQFWESGKKLAEVGAANGMTINPDQLIAAAATGAAAGAAVAGLGAVAGAIIAVGVYVVGAIFGGNRPSVYDNAGANVHWWFTNYGQQAYLDWTVDTDNQGVFESVQTAAAGQLMYWLETYGYIIRPGATFYNGRGDMDYAYEAAGTTDAATAYTWTRQFYGNLGIDWDATVELWDTEGRGPFMMKNRAFIGDAPGAPDDEQPAEGANTAGVVLGLSALAALAYIATRKGTPSN